MSIFEKFHTSFPSMIQQLKILFLCYDWFPIKLTNLYLIDLDQQLLVMF